MINMEEFDLFQKKEIDKGLQSGVDVEIYANPEYNWSLMQQIRLGLESKVDVSLYNKDYYNRLQMQEIREGLELGIDTKVYANPDFSAESMRLIKDCLKNGEDVSSWAKPEISFDVLELLHKTYKDGYDVSRLINPEYSYWEVSVLSQALRDGYDLFSYAEQGFDANQLEQIYLGMKDGVDYRQYAKPGISWFKMQDYRKQLQRVEHIIDYFDIKGFSHSIILDYASKGIDIIPYIKAGLDNKQIAAIANGIKLGINMDKYVDPKYSVLKLNLIIDGYKKGLDVSQYDNCDLSISQMTEIYKALLDDVYVEDLAKPDVDSSLMQFVFTCRRFNVNYDKYLDKGFKGRQLYALSLAVKYGVDLDLIDDVNLSGDEMEDLVCNEIRKKEQAASRAAKRKRNVSKMNIIDK